MYVQRRLDKLSTCALACSIYFTQPFTAWPSSPLPTIQSIFHVNTIKFCLPWSYSAFTLLAPSPITLQFFRLCFSSYVRAGEEWKRSSSSHGTLVCIDWNQLWDMEQVNRDWILIYQQTTIPDKHTKHWNMNIGGKPLDNVLGPMTSFDCITLFLQSSLIIKWKLIKNKQLPVFAASSHFYLEVKILVDTYTIYVLYAEVPQVLGNTFLQLCKNNAYQSPQGHRCHKHSSVLWCNYAGSLEIAQFPLNLWSDLRREL